MLCLSIINSHIMVTYHYYILQSMIFFIEKVKCNKYLFNLGVNIKSLVRLYYFLAGHPCGTYDADCMSLKWLDDMSCLNFIGSCP